MQAAPPHSAAKVEASAGSPNSAARSVDAAPHVEVAAHVRLAGGGEPGAAGGVADQRRERQG